MLKEGLQSLETLSRFKEAIDTSSASGSQALSLQDLLSLFQQAGLDQFESLSYFFVLCRRDAGTERSNKLAADWAAVMMNGPNGPHATPPQEGGSAVLGAALNALRQPPGLNGNSINPGQLSLFLQQLLADGDGNEAPVLGRSQRRMLVATAVERVGAEGFSRAFVDALGNLR